MNQYRIAGHQSPPDKLSKFGYSYFLYAELDLYLFKDFPTNSSIRPLVYKGFCCFSIDKFEVAALGLHTA